LIAAAGFFLYKVIAGYLFPNLEVSLDCSRQPNSHSGKDFLKITVTLTKGEYGTLRIHDVQARITPENSDARSVSFIGVERRSFLSQTFNGHERKIIDWGNRSKKNPFLQISPKEKTQFSAYAEIPPEVPCVIDVAILGKILASSKFGQWRASSISLPLK
jgi:hypothetical protein